MPNLVDRYISIIPKEQCKTWNSSKLSLCVGVCCKSLRKFVKGLNWFISDIEYWFKIVDSKPVQQTYKRISGKVRQILEFFKNIFPNLEFHIKLFRSPSKTYIESSEPWNNGLSVFNAKTYRRIQNYFPDNAKQTLLNSSKLSEMLIFILEFPINLFGFLSKS